MAEFALGLTKMAVEGTLSRVKSAIDEEQKLKVLVQNDLVFITGEFEMMQSFLNVANKERTKNEVVRTWVTQIRNLAFDVEDCVELVISLDIKSSSSWWRRMMPSCMAPSRPIDQAVTEIQQLKARVEDVSHRNTRYNLIGDSGSSSNSAVTAVSSIMMPHSHTSAASAFHTLNEVWDEAGKKRCVTGDLKKLIIDEGSDLQVVSLWGSPDTVDFRMPHIIREAYNDPEICQEFKTRAWIKLKHPSNPNELLKLLQTQFYASSHSQANVVGVDFQKKMKAVVAMEDEIMDQLCEQRYLIIVEQLSTVVDWDVIRMYLPDTNKGSRIVVSTQHLGLAFSCTGKPYQVSELRHFSHDKPLCAFIKKVPGRRSDMSEFCWELKQGGMVSVWEEQTSLPASSTRPYSKSATFLDSLYTSIMHNSQGFDVDGLEFEKYSWVDVPSPFNLEVFSRRLLLSFYSDDFGAMEIAVVGRMGEGSAIEYCRGVLHDHKCLLVINGVEKADDWDLIKTNLLYRPTKGCILAITNSSTRDHLDDNESLARHCVDEKDRAINIKELEADKVLCHLIKDSQYHGIGGKEASRRGRLFTNRMEEARIWTNKFGHVFSRTDACRLHHTSLSEPGVVSVWGTAGAGKLPLVRRIYYNQMLKAPSSDLGFTKFSWVDVPCPFNLRDFFWRLLLDFHSDDLKAKETVAIGLIEGNDPIDECQKFMHQDKCFIVINGLCSIHYWNMIRDALSSEPNKSCIVVITNEESIATHCADNKDRLHHVKGVEADAALRPLIKDCGYYGNECGVASRFFSSRRQEATYWAKTFEPVGRQIRVAADVAGHSCYGLSSVWGIAGVGKSAIVRSIYCHRMLNLGHYVYNNRRSVVHMHGKCTKFSWVNVPHPFSLLDFCCRLLVDFHSDDLEAKENVVVGIVDGVLDPIQECRKFLHTECFVVIDGLGSTSDWDLIRDSLLPETTKGCIIVIANEGTVARHCVPNVSRVVNVKGLEPDAALRLLSMVALGAKQFGQEDTEVSKLTIAKCGGLPKVIVAIGKQCRGTKISGLKYLNMNFMDQLQTNSSFHSLRGLFSWMRSYFDACSDALKPCIFYLSVFNADCNIRRRRLLRRWIAEGYCMDKFGISAEEDGEALFSELVKLSIIQEPPQNLYHMTSQQQRINVGVFQVNGFFHGYIMSQPIEDNLVFALEGCCSPNSKHVGQHLTIRSSWDRDEIVFKSMDMSRLRSLTVFGEWMPFFISKDVNMGLLRVLDLEDTSGVTDGSLNQIGKLLPRLKFLSVRRCKDISRVPDSLGGLRQLQTLDVRDTSVVELPRSIIKLHKLQYIRAGTTDEPLDQGHDTIQPELGDRDGTSTSQPAIVAADSEGASRSKPKPTPPMEADSTSTNQSAGTRPADAHGASTSQPTATPPADGDDQDLASSTLAPLRNRACHLVSLFSKEKKLRRQQQLNNVNGGGVKVPAAGIGNMTALHTFGVVNVSGPGGKTILKELKKLTQLRKLGLSGINGENWPDLCCAISGHGYLESLSVRIHNEQQDHDHLYFLGDISKPPNTLKSLKLYGGNVHVSPGWMKPLSNLKKLHLEHHELIISTQEEIEILMELPCRDMYHQLCVKLIQDGELRYGRWDSWWLGEEFTAATVLKIDCGSHRLAIAFGGWIPTHVKVLVVHCSTTEASLEISGLEQLRSLKEVWLKGSYSEAVKQHLQKKLVELPEWMSGVTLKLEEQQLTPTLPSAC